MKPWKVQKFFEDVVYDLRNRGLLPVVILLVVAMVAVPVLLSRGNGGSSGSPLQPTAVASKPAPEGEQAVVAYHPPGLRNYKTRLNDQPAKNPFSQPFVPGNKQSSSQLNSAVQSPTTVSPSTSSSVSSGSVSSRPSTVSTKPRLFYFHSVADLSFGPTDQELTRHKKIKAFTPLPNETAPVVIYLGSTLDGKRAIFSISKFTDQLSGPGTCAPGPTDCSLLALAKGQSEDMVFAGDGKTYRLKINDISRVVSNKLPTG